MQLAIRWVGLTHPLKESNFESAESEYVTDRGLEGVHGRHLGKGPAPRYDRKGLPGRPYGRPACRPSPSMRRFMRRFISGSPEKIPKPQPSLASWLRFFLAKLTSALGVLSDSYQWPCPSTALSRCRVARSHPARPGLHTSCERPGA